MPTPNGRISQTERSGGGVSHSRLPPTASLRVGVIASARRRAPAFQHPLGIGVPLGPSLPPLCSALQCPAACQNARHRAKRGEGSPSRFSRPCRDFLMGHAGDGWTVNGGRPSGRRWWCVEAQRIGLRDVGLGVPACRGSVGPGTWVSTTRWNVPPPLPPPRKIRDF